MIDRTQPLRIGVPDVPAARALAAAWASASGPVGSVSSVALEHADLALRSGQVDLAFVPTLSVLRDPEAYSVVPGVALVGKAYPSASVHVRAGLGAVARDQEPRLGFDPIFAQEAILTQIVFREAYGSKPQFVPVESNAARDDVDAYLLPDPAVAPDGGVVLNLGREWFELTTRPMVWALLVSTAGGVDPAEAAYLQSVAHELEGDVEEPSVEEPTSITLAAYAHAGLETWMEHLFYHRAIEEMVEIPFVAIGDEEDADDEYEDEEL